MASGKAVDTAAIRALLKTLEDQPQSTAEAHLQSLIDDASQPRHMSGNACITLCFFLEQCQKSGSPVLRDLVSSEDTCQKLFDFYVEWNERNQHRSMRQVLELLAALMARNAQTECGKSFRSTILERLLSIIMHQAAQPLVKPAFKMLECFLSKGTFALEDILQAYQKLSSRAPADLPKHHVMNKDVLWDSLVSDIFQWMSLPDTASAAGKLLVVLLLEMKSVAKSEERQDLSVNWQRWIVDGLAKHPDSLENIKNYLFPPLFKADKPRSLQFLKELSGEQSIESIGDHNSDSHSLLLLAAMEVGKKLGLVDELDVLPAKKTRKAAAKSQSYVLLPTAAVGELLKHRDSKVRSSAFSVLILSLSSAKPFSEDTIRVLKENLYTLHADTDAKSRNELFTNSKYMLERLKGAMALLNRELQSQLRSVAASKNNHDAEPTAPVGSDDAQTSSTVLEYHREFLMWYIDFLQQQVVSTASYQRHISALRSIQLLLKSGLQPSTASVEQKPSQVSDSVWPEQVDLFSETLTRLLLDLLVDPFEEVRNASFEILRQAPAAKFGERIATPYGHLPELLVGLLERAMKASQASGRADIADGVAHVSILCHLTLQSAADALNSFSERISQLEQTIVKASHDVSTAAEDRAPIHAELASIRRIWELYDPKASPESVGVYKEFQRRLASACDNLWNVVKDALCNDAPEGNAKPVLSFSFRSCHESSLLIQAMIQKAQLPDVNGTPLLSFEEFKTLAGITFDQLSSLRHRGAISTVTTTFENCCRMTQHKAIKSAGGDELLNQWFEGAVACINLQFATTRRSAGLPALITGVLAASSTSVSFAHVMSTLQSVARRPVEQSVEEEQLLPQVHAMNSLREIFKSTTLGKRANAYVTECFALAADRLNSPIWAIQNVGLLLIRSLVDCLLGTSEAKEAVEAGWDGRSTRISFEQYPGLPELLLSLLQPGQSGEVDPKRVFPALDLIRRVGPPNRNNAEFQQRLYRAIAAHLCSSQIDVRDLAARTAVVFFVNGEAWDSNLQQLLLEQPESSNWLHGVLLLVKHVLQKRTDLQILTANATITPLLKAIKSRVSTLQPRPSSDIILTTYEEVLCQVVDMQIGRKTALIDALPEADMLWSPKLKFSHGDLDRFAQWLASKGPSSSLPILKKAVLRRFVSDTIDNKGEVEVIITIISRLAPQDEDLVVDVMEATKSRYPFDELKPQQVLSVLDKMAQLKQQPITGRVLSLLLTLVQSVLESISLSEWSSDQLLTLRHVLESPSFYSFGGLYTGQDGSVIDSPELARSIMALQAVLLRLRMLFATGVFELDEEHDHSHGCHCHDNNDKLGGDLRVYGWAIKDALDEQNDFDTRKTAADALANVFGINGNPELIAIFNSVGFDALFGLHLAVFDCLFDDDEEIRATGAEAASFLCGKDECPEAAATSMIDWLFMKYETNPRLAAEVLQRLTLSKKSVQSTNRLDFTDLVSGGPSELFEEAFVIDNALFVEEKQNLYVDPLTVLGLWIRWFVHADGEVWDFVTGELEDWALKSVDIISGKMDEQDGPFGWSSKQDVFALISRVILILTAVKVRKSLAVDGEEEPTVGSEAQGNDRWVVMKEFKEKARHCNLHPSLVFPF